jgi:hypothetical protein
MEKHKIVNAICLILLNIFLSVMLSSCFFDDRIEVRTYNEMRDYQIDPSSILDSIARGNINIFSLQKATPDVNLSLSDNNFFWSQEEYIEIARALLKFSWEESMDDLRLKSMNFYLQCSDTRKTAFSSANYEFEKNILTGEKESRIKYLISINPWKKSIYTSKEIFSPNIKFINHPINLAQYQISADKALQIAEINGGIKTRNQVENKCKISIFTYAIERSSWSISYGSVENINKSLFRIEIDPRLGTFKVLNTLP